MQPAGFEWDGRKRALNLEKHGIDFRDAIGLSEPPHLTVDTIRTGEVRKVGHGKVARCLVAVVWADRAGNIRIISARAARRNERQAYTARFAA
jgi:uncharacterized protein